VTNSSRAGNRRSPCRSHHYVWSVDREQLSLLDDVDLVAQLVSQCAHCGQVEKRWEAPMDLGRRQAAASQASHDERCTNRAPARAPGAWRSAGGESGSR
jgi:hypothetical protein